jgi:FMN-dependent NADH-azoreductase
MEETTMAGHTLLVSYLPNGERSNTKRLVDAFLAGAHGERIERLDLTREIPDVFTEDRLAAFGLRNYLGQILTPEQEAQLTKMDRMTTQLISADRLVLATPMHNFSMPAPVKGWFDSVIQKDRTFRMTPDGQYEGLLAGRPALVLTSTGGVYEGELAAMDHLHGLAGSLLGMMGFEVEFVSAQGINQFPDRKEAILQSAVEQVVSAARNWYGTAVTAA